MSLRRRYLIKRFILTLGIKWITFWEYWKLTKMDWQVLRLASRKRMECRCLLGHLLITFACSNKPARRGEVFSDARVNWVVWDILGKLDQLFLEQAFWVKVGIPESYVSRTCILLLIMSEYMWVYLNIMCHWGLSKIESGLKINS